MANFRENKVGKAKYPSFLSAPDTLKIVPSSSTKGAVFPVPDPQEHTFGNVFFKKPEGSRFSQEGSRFGSDAARPCSCGRG